MPSRETPTIRSPRQLSLPAFLFLLLAFFGFIAAINGWEYGRILEISEDPGDKRAMLSNLARSSTTLISTVFACLFLAIPLTANMYTPQLLDLFVGSWTNRLVLLFYVFSAAYSISLGRVSRGVDVPSWHFKLAEIVVLVSMVLLLPYLFSVFRFLDPNTIVRRVGARAMRALDPGASGRIADRRDELTRRIRQLGNIALKSLERSDRDVALAAGSALDTCASRYLELKPEHGEAWFRVGPDQFPGLAREALEFVNDDRVWVEMEIQRELNRAFTAALAKVPDVISAISRAQRHTAVEASRRGDRGALELALRHFNNFLREAVKRRDIHAIYDLLYQFRMLGEELWERDAARVVKAARHLDYYGRLARDTGVGFAYDLVAYDLGALAAAVPSTGDGDLSALVDVFLEVGRGRDGSELAPGVFKARLVTAALMRERDRVELAERIEATLGGSGSAQWEIAERDVLGDTEPWFWEVTDRMRDLNYLPESARRHVREELDRLRYGKA
ncbi:MAG: DUF2254 family protein [Planctomycetota bacterium]